MINFIHCLEILKVIYYNIHPLTTSFFLINGLYQLKSESCSVN